MSEKMTLSLCPGFGVEAGMEIVSWPCIKMILVATKPPLGSVTPSEMSPNSKQGQETRVPATADRAMSVRVLSHRS